MGGSESEAGEGRAICYQINVEERGAVLFVEKRKEKSCCGHDSLFYINDEEGQKGELGKWGNGREERG